MHPCTLRHEGDLPRLDEKLVQTTCFTQMTRPSHVARLTHVARIMQMIMETIYRSLEGCRVALCLKDAKKGAITARFGYGKDTEVITSHFSIPLAYHADVFHIAFKNNVDIHIEDTKDIKIKAKIPDWYHDNIGARSFTIFPIVIKHSPIALIYIDNGNNKPIPISDTQLGLLKTLRNQAILAIKSNS